MLLKGSRAGADTGGMSYPLELRCLPAGATTREQRLGAALLEIEWASRRGRQTETLRAVNEIARSAICDLLGVAKPPGSTVTGSA
jgi:hypothetical protein